MPKTVRKRRRPSRRVGSLLPPPLPKPGPAAGPHSRVHRRPPSRPSARKPFPSDISTDEQDPSWEPKSALTGGGLGGRWRNQCRPLPTESVNILKRWMSDHWYNPYPNRTEKAVLSQEANVSIVELSNWFANARLRGDYGPRHTVPRISMMGGGPDRTGPKRVIQAQTVWPDFVTCLYGSGECATKPTNICQTTAPASDSKDPHSGVPLDVGGALSPETKPLSGPEKHAHAHEHAQETPPPATPEDEEDASKFLCLCLLAETAVAVRQRGIEHRCGCGQQAAQQAASPSYWRPWGVARGGDDPRN